jgi:hypothetical protein
VADPDKALATMIKNVEAQTGKTLADFAQVIGKSGLTKHGEIRSMLMKKFDLGHGQANMVVHLALKSDGQSTAEARGLSAGDVVAELYADKPDLGPIHEKILGLLDGLGGYEMVPKKGYVSYRRRKQFAMVGPKTKTAIEVGLGAKALGADARLKEMPPASMCRFTTRVTSLAAVDAKLRGWLKTSYDEAE